MKHDISGSEFKQLLRKEKVRMIDARCNPNLFDWFEVGVTLALIFALILLAGYFS